MEDKIAALISERAPWLYDRRAALPRRLIERLLCYDRTVKLATRFQSATSSQIMETMGRHLSRDVTVHGLGHIPHHGPALIVANHPTGIADGIILHRLLAGSRPDTYFFANSDILRVLPQMSDMIAPVEWRRDRRCHGKTRETMAYVRDATEAGRLGVIFPSGRLAKRRGLKLHERPWMASAAMLARKFDLPVIPVHIQARNSVLFYLFDLIHPTLRDVTLFHETLNKNRQPFRIRVGEPIAARALPKNSEDGIAMLRKATLALGEDAPAVSLVKATRPLLRG
ncbi:Acyltransferase [Cognatiyoonia koreensis]|uniref:Acyltransferase n=1 Tax=Cognatiyoonia koreensis TaxID=364200 RepID=A0A1I0Q1J9_9RHOB|nr:lysophospholipid acyltransferase family protein [Cognatiyoonia koreensis]SEW20669.1 Acyltransferase [Cognatiyoonia koreensis]